MILSRQDLSDPENVKTCIAEYRKIADFERGHRDDYIREWADNWAEAIFVALDSHEPDRNELGRVEDELGEAEKRNTALMALIGRASDVVEKIDTQEMSPNAVAKVCDQVMNLLESASE